MKPTELYLLLAVYIGLHCTSVRCENCTVQECPEGFRPEPCSPTSLSTTTATTTTTGVSETPLSNSTESTLITTYDGNCTCNNCTHCYNGQNWTVQCVNNSASNNSTSNNLSIKIENEHIGAIVGGAVGGVVAVTVLVIIIVCCLRRRRNAKSRTNETAGNISQSESSAHLKVPDEEQVETRNGGGSKNPTYENMQNTAPSRVSIERGIDKVTRYVRDPTVKKDIQHSISEEKELEYLGEAPPPPVRPLPSALSKVTETPEETYEDVDEDKKQFTQSQEVTPHAKTTIPKRSNTSTAPSKSSHQNKRKQQGPLPQLISISSPDVSTNFPKPKAKPTPKPTEDEEPEDDYENVQPPCQSANPSKRSFRALPPEPTTEEGESDDQDDYINVQAKGPLLTSSHKDSPQVHVNQGANLEDEPQEIYGNQDVVDSQTLPPRRDGNDMHPTDTYIDMEGSKEEHPYENLPVRSRK